MASTLPRIPSLNKDGKILEDFFCFSFLFWLKNEFMMGNKSNKLHILLIAPFPLYNRIINWAFPGVIARILKWLWRFGVLGFPFGLNFVMNIISVHIEL